MAPRIFNQPMLYAKDKSRQDASPLGRNPSEPSQIRAGIQLAIRKVFLCELGTESADVRVC
jgi:hypothetical protein